MAKKLFFGLILCFIAFSIVFYIQKKPELVSHQTSDSSAMISSSETGENEIASTSEKPIYPGRADDWELLVVNEKHKIKEEPTDLKELPNGMQIDSRIFDSYEALNKAAKKAGFDLTIISAYRSVAEQESIVARDTQSYLDQGFSEEESKKRAMEYLTVPGLSEHHTGLAMDVLEEGWYNDGNMLEEEFGETKAGKWLDENVCHYGFVIRYQKGKEKITGINYEPWHIRYVGKENAEYMKDHDLVLEEYVEQIKK